MVTAEERIRILRMLQEGKVSPEAAAQLLEALGEGGTSPSEGAASQAGVIPAVAAPPAPSAAMDIPEVPGRKPRWLRVRVTAADSGRPKVNVRLPIGLVSLGMKIGAKYSPEIEGIDVDALIQAAQTGDGGAFVDVFDDEDGEHVEVFLE